MKNIMKTISAPRRFALAAACLAIILACFVLCTSCGAKEYSDASLNYTVSGDSATIVGYYGEKASVTVPAAIDGKTVTTIAEGAFKDSKATEVNLPPTITDIEAGAFTVGTLIISTSSSGEQKQQEAADDGKNTGSTGADFTRAAAGDTVEVGGISLNVVTADDGMLTLADASGKTYHTNGCFVISDSEHKPLKGDISISYSNGVTETFTAAEDTASAASSTRKIMPFVIILVVALAGAFVFVLWKRKRR